ncbi:MAG: hypothetical protein V4664_03800 [Patescibacteria group bacterium]
MKLFLRKYIVLLLITLVILLAGISVYLYKKNTNNPEAISQAEVKSLVTKVGRLMILPQGETPTIATVSDPEALKDQAFFADAKKGDKVLIYSNAKKAILYSPSEDKIVTIAPLNSDAGAKTDIQTPAAETSKTDNKN